jgi:hypothetical protein
MLSEPLPNESNAAFEPFGEIISDNVLDYLIAVHGDCLHRLPVSLIIEIPRGLKLGGRAACPMDRDAVPVMANDSLTTHQSDHLVDCLTAKAFRVGAHIEVDHTLLRAPARSTGWVAGLALDELDAGTSLASGCFGHPFGCSVRC